MAGEEPEMRIASEFTLPSGLTLKNRLVKSAMTEDLANEYGHATDELVTLYKTWAEKSGCGLLVSGNLQIDRRFLERSRNVCIDLDFGEQTDEQLMRLQNMVNAGKSSGTKFICQIAHAGRQSTTAVAKRALAPSAIPVVRGGVQMADAVEATTEQIDRIVEKFVYAAKICKKVGFDGVQLHGAHGYLLSSFLNPRANKRTDQYGGSLENRASIMLKIVRIIRKELGSDFTLSVKLNTADFQRGGFSVEEAVSVAIMLAKEGLDLLEVSGGNYESGSHLTGNLSNAHKIDPELPFSPEIREAYFLSFAMEIADALKEKNLVLPLIVTGGFRSADVMNKALASGKIDLIGIARPLCVDPECTSHLLNKKIKTLPRPEINWSLPGCQGWKFLRKFPSLNAKRIGAIQKVLIQNLTLMGQDKFTAMSDDDFPDILVTAEERVKYDDVLAKGLKGYKSDDQYVWEFLRGQQ